MHAVQLSQWTVLGAVALVVVGVFLAMGYGIIGILFLFLLAVLLGGALMSYIGGD